MNHRFFKLGAFIVVALIMRFIVGSFLDEHGAFWLQVVLLFAIFAVGIGFVFRGTAKVIEETTDVLKDRTGLAGGFLQAVGTAFPDMVIGVVAALISLSVRDVDYVRAVNLAIIAAATTFGSNIYNIIHATWCVYRQNIADARQKTVHMFPFFAFGGSVKPISHHSVKPTIREMDTAIRILTVLTLLTGFVGVSMVIFGKVEGGQQLIAGDLYQLIQPVGIVLFILTAWVLYIFRATERQESPIAEVVHEERYYATQKTWRIWLDLVLSGVAILLAAEAMVSSMEVFSHITHVPFVLTGVLAGLIGCFGEMVVIHNFSVSPKGRIGDAIVGVAMDNIVTVMGASIVAIIGGIFLGSNALILIFILILAANTVLIEQISRLKNTLHTHHHTQ